MPAGCSRIRPGVARRTTLGAVQSRIFASTSSPTATRSPLRWLDNRGARSGTAGIDNFLHTSPCHAGSPTTCSRKPRMRARSGASRSTPARLLVLFDPAAPRAFHRPKRLGRRWAWGVPQGPTCAALFGLELPRYGWIRRRLAVFLPDPLHSVLRSYRYGHTWDQHALSRFETVAPNARPLISSAVHSHVQYRANQVRDRRRRA